MKSPDRIDNLLKNSKKRLLKASKLTQWTESCVLPCCKLMHWANYPMLKGQERLKWHSDSTFPSWYCQQLLCGKTSNISVGALQNGKEPSCRGVGKLQVFVSFECLCLSHFTCFSPTTELNFLT